MMVKVLQGDDQIHISLGINGNHGGSLYLERSGAGFADGWILNVGELITGEICWNAIGIVSVDDFNNLREGRGQ